MRKIKTNFKNMKIAISREKEIDNISKFLSECSWLSDEIKRSDFEYIDFKEFEVFKKFDTKDVEIFLSDLVRHAKALYWEKAIWNLRTLLDNCADKNLDHLDFSPKIKQGFDAVELLKEINECLTDEKEIMQYKEKITKLLSSKIDE